MHAVVQGQVNVCSLVRRFYLVLLVFFRYCKDGAKCSSESQNIAGTFKRNLS